MKDLLHQAQRFGLCPFEMGVFKKKKKGTGMSFTMVRMWLNLRRL